MDELSISAYPPFTDTVLKFSRFNLLIGKNGIGKSRLLEFIFNKHEMTGPNSVVQIIKEDRFIDHKTRYRPGPPNFTNVFGGCQNFDVNDEKKENFNSDMSKLFKREFHIDNFENHGRTIIIKKGNITTTPKSDGIGILNCWPILEYLHYCPNDISLFIEEIALGLHPAKIPEYLDLICKIMEDKNIQLFATSQDLFTVLYFLKNNFEGYDWVDNENPYTVFSLLEEITENENSDFEKTCIEKVDKSNHTHSLNELLGNFPGSREYELMGYFCSTER